MTPFFLPQRGKLFVVLNCKLCKAPYNIQMPNKKGCFPSCGLKNDWGSLFYS